MEHLSHATEAQVHSDPGFVPVPLSITPYNNATMVLPPSVYEELRTREIANRSRFQMDLLSDSDEEQSIAAAVAEDVASADAENIMDTGELSTDTELAAGTSTTLYINKDCVAEAVRSSVTSPESGSIPVRSAHVEEAVSMDIRNVTRRVAEQRHLRMQEELMGMQEEFLNEGPAPMEAEPSVEPRGRTREREPDATDQRGRKKSKGRSKSRPAPRVAHVLRADTGVPRVSPDALRADHGKRNLSALCSRN